MRPVCARNMFRRLKFVTRKQSISPIAQGLGTFVFNNGSLESEQVGFPSLVEVDNGAANDPTASTTLPENDTVFQFNGDTSNQSGFTADLPSNRAFEWRWRFTGGITGFRRLIDTSGGTQDWGLYANANKLVLFNKSAKSWISAGPDRTSNNWQETTFFRLYVRVTGGKIEVWESGTKINFTDPDPPNDVQDFVPDDGSLDISSGTPVRFFLDDGTEWAPFEIAYFNVFSPTADVNTDPLPNQSDSIRG